MGEVWTADGRSTAWIYHTPSSHLQVSVCKGSHTLEKWCL